MAEKKLKKLSKKRSASKASAKKKTTARKATAGAKRTSSARARPASAESIRESASQIWLAGLGAVSKAQEEGARFFENLVRDGLNLEKKTRKATSTRIHEVKDAVEDRVEDVQKSASSSWEKLEKVFEDRVAKALSGLGVPTREDVRELKARVRDLQKSVDELVVARVSSSKTSPASRKKAATRKTAKKTVRKAAAKKTARKASKKKAASK